MSDACYYQELLDIATEERWQVQDRLLEEILDEVTRLTANSSGLSYVPAEPLVKFLELRRIQLAVQCGRMSPNEARELLGVPKWAQ